MAINFNAEPYYDDFDEAKGFHRILFKPGYAVQARELTQLQTILQRQISKFGDHVFREGSIVLGGAFDLETDLAYVKLASINTSLGITYYTGKNIVGQTTGLTAHVRHAYQDPDTLECVLLVRYLSSTETNTVFEANEVVQIEGTEYTASTAASGVNGIGSLFSIAEGVVYTKGFFAVFPGQSIILDPFSATPTLTVGFNVAQTIITADDDQSLLDNAQGSFNFAAPGADRLAMDVTLTTLPYGEGSTDPNFVLLANIKDGSIEVSKERSQYSRVYEEIAKRTYDESGDYYVNGFGVRTREHLSVDNNEGLLLAADGGDANKLSIDIEPGLAYVKGYEVNTRVTEHVITDKSTDFQYVSGQLVTARTGDYVNVKEVVGSIPLDVGQLVNIYSAAETRITSKLKSTTAASGSVIGTARVKSVVYSSGNVGQADGQYSVYLYDIKMTTGNFSSARALGIVGTFFGDIVLTNGSAVLQESNDSDMLFPIGTQYTRKVKNEAGTSLDTQFYCSRTETKAINLADGGGTTTITVTTTGETLPYSTGFLSATEKTQLIVSYNADQSYTMAGTVSGTISTSTLTGTGTFFTRLNVGDKITVSGTVYIISAIASNTSLTVVGTLVATYSGAAYTKTHFAGDIIDLNDIGSAAGATRTVEVLSSTAMKIDLKENIPGSGSVNVTVSYRISRSNASQANKDLRANRYVKIACSSLSSLTNPINLGFSDVYRIKEIRKDTSAFTSATQGTDVTSLFKFDDGQRDSFYSHATIRPTGITLTTADYLLVKLDYFNPNISAGFGYFSVDSYPVNDAAASDTTIFTYQIPSYTSDAGITYNLRDVLDFRPVLTNTAADATTVAGASVNPALSTTYVTDAGGLRLAVPSTNISVDYSYYLARRDVVTLDKDGFFNIIKGTPSANPVSPQVPENVMALANVYIPPYPSISETLGRILGRMDITCSTRRIANVRYTMREIGVLKNRIETLEYYTALTLLEKSAMDLTVLDSSGLDRFKNGVFVDGFLDHSLGATTSIDYKIAVDKVEQAIRPRFVMNSVKYKLNSTESSGYQQTGNVITRPYTEEVLLDQPRATGIRNIEQSVFRFIGTIDMVPATDVWADTTTVDKTYEYGNEMLGKQFMSTEWGSWEKYITGYNVYDRSVGDRSGKIDPNLYLGTYTSYGAAVAATSNTAYVVNGKVQGGADNRALIETFQQNIRTGIQTTVTYEKQTQHLGNFVTDVSVIPYIRPQVISLYAKGLKAGTRYYVFFDGEDMTSFLTPYVIPPSGVQNATQLLTEGAAWRSDEFGDVFGLLRLPATGKRFRTGTKEVIITDSPTNSADATSYAKAYFVAQGLNVNKQNTILSTAVPITVEKNVTDLSQRITQKTQVMGPSCMAYSFKVVAPPGEDGVFLTSVDVFIKEMHPTLGVWFEIREMDSAGGITRNQVPYSEVWMKRDDPRIVLTEDGSTPTNVDFPVPVFLYNDTQYAFVIHTEGLNPNTYFWVSRLGENDVVTGEQVTSRQLTGTLFTTNNNLNYDMVPDIDMKIKFYRAKFTTGSGTVVLGNIAQEYLEVSNVTGEFGMIGETIYGSERVTLASLVGAASIAVGDKITGLSSGITGNIISISGSQYLTDAIGYTQGESFQLKTSAGVNKDKTGVISVVERGIATLESYDSSTGVITVTDSNGKFFVGSRLRGRQSTNTATVTGFSEFKYSTVHIKPNYLLFKGADCTFEKQGLNSTTLIYGDWSDANVDTTSSFTVENAILSRAEELTNAAVNGSTSSKLRASMSTTSEYVSPVIDLTRAQCVLVKNIINNDDTGETAYTGGNLLNKYISKTVTLADGQDAEDLLVILSAYRPEGSTIKVWMKIRNSDDALSTESFDDKPWIELTPAADRYSSSVNSANYVEISYGVPTSNKNGSGVVQYTANGNTYIGFKQFAIKIGLMGTNSALVPKVADLRVIALQV